MPNAYWKDKDSYRSQPRPAGWKKTRERIIARDGGACQWRDQADDPICGQPGREVDHIVPVFTAKTEADLAALEQDTNLQLLCTWHHRHKTSSDAGKESQRRRPKRQRPPEKHPGLI